MSEYPRSPAAPPSIDGFLGTLRALAEPTRLRLALLLCSSELTVTEISHVIGQSQPRTSRHLRLLLDADILERSPEGAHVFYRVCDGGDRADLVRQLADRVPAGDPLVAADAAALERVLAARVQAAATCLRSHDDEVAALRSLQVAEADVEHAMLELIGATEPIERLLDIGTGTGRILELLAPVSERSVGLDVSRDMVAAARAKLGEARLSRASVRHGDLHRPPFEAASFDVAVMHHVLHLLDDPGEAVADAARLLRPGGLRPPSARAAARATRPSPPRDRRPRPARVGCAVRSGDRGRADPARARAPAAHRGALAASRPGSREHAKGGGRVSVTVSFEFFPPRTPEAEQHFWSVLERLAPLEPAFVSVTYGAGGNTRESTLETLREIGVRTTIPRAGHLTCVGCPREEVDATIRDYWEAGIAHIVALRGDMPELGSAFVAHPKGYEGSVELVRAIRAIAPFEVSVAAYPEPHPDSRSAAKDLDLLARKAEAGATRALTQFCFINEHIVALRDRVASAGIGIPVVPGIMFATNLARPVPP